MGDLEPFDVGEADVEQDEVGSEGSGGLETRQSVRGFADDLEAVRSEERARLDTESGGVIDDKDGVHVSIVAGAATPSYRVTPDRLDIGVPARRRPPARP